MLKSLKSSGGGQPREQFERNGKRKYKNEPEEKGKLWWNYGSFGSGAFERAEVEAKNVAIERKARQNGKTKSEGKDFGKKGKHKGNVDSQQCKFAWNWVRECPNRMVQQVQFGTPASSSGSVIPVLPQLQQCAGSFQYHVVCQSLLVHWRFQCDW